MAEDAPSPFYSSPEILSLPLILERLQGGELLIPSFHRPLVWPRELRLALLESVLQGIPIGAILVWRTTLTKVRAKELVGPFRLPKASDSRVHQYLLDGQQRLMALFLALCGVERLTPGELGPVVPLRDDEAAEDFETYFDLVENRFVVRSELKAVTPVHLPLVDVLISRRLTRFQRQMQNALSSSHLTSEMDVLSDRADRLADAFRQYMLPVIPMTSDSLDAVATTFQRINSAQVAVSEAQMINALVHPTGGLDFLDRVDSIRNEKLAKLGWATLDEQVVVRACKIDLGLAVNEAQAEELSRRFAEDPTVLDRVAEHLSSAATFFSEDLHIRAPELVPHQAQIVLVAAAFRREPEMSEKARSRLAAWVQATTYAGVFARPVSERQLRQLREDVESVVSGRRPSLDIAQLARRPLDRFDFRSGRARLLAVSLAERDPLDPTEKSEWRQPSDQLAKRGADVVPQIVGPSLVGQSASTSPGARVVLPRESVPALRAVLRDPSTYAGAFDALCRSHLISPAAQSAFASGSYLQFVQLREDEMNHMEDVRFKSALEKVYGDGA